MSQAVHRMHMITLCLGGVIFHTAVWETVIHTGLGHRQATKYKQCTHKTANEGAN